MGKLIPVIMLLIGAGAGVGAGIFLAPPEASVAELGEGEQGKATEHDEDHDSSAGEKSGEPGKTKSEKKSTEHGDGHGEEENQPDYIKLNNQFVIPVVGGNRVEALVVLSLSIEAENSVREAIYAREPKIRDAFLQVLFDHSNMGGFQGIFTQASNLDILRRALTDVAQQEFGSGVHRVLITDIARQDA